ncbi:LSU ribosomal protein L18p (L5e) [Dissulfuribacter thermophilus]|uniref:Large ribosomal subunit protein uL18 n=1 Tax=Dissulfuribacter thermophilus TaxID=1156395 RepID=A0A1B9F5B4_9BACT|nr:50S ribosomal protein L18 [Dissulfuribacter thermophilus]OCC15063.1 LSU ribosomal protein L18p (L5e) [Dissulfuribacter thermophilus]
MKALKKKVKARLRRKMRIRKRLSGTPDRPRLAVFRSAKHIYAQIIDDTKGVTIVSASSLSPEIRDRLGECKGKKEVAKLVGELIAKRALEKDVKKVAFDRGGYKYHGRVKALADGARETGLEF